MSGWASFQKDGRWYTFDSVEVLDLDRDEPTPLENVLKRMNDVRLELVAKGWTDLKLKVGGRYDDSLVFQGIRLEDEAETANRKRHEKAIEEMHQDHEKSEYERLKKIYG